MKIRLILCLLLLLLLIVSSVYFAQDGSPRRGPGGRDMLRMLPVMVALDADGDGVISAAEIDNATVALRKLDKNGDGKLTEDELRPNFPQGGPGGRGGPAGGAGPSVDDIVKDLLAFDKNGDGQLTKVEVPERMHGLFERGDVNQDGNLNNEELRKLAAAQSAGAVRRDEHKEAPGEGERRPQRPPNQ